MFPRLVRIRLVGVVVLFALFGVSLWPVDASPAHQPFNAHPPTTATATPPVAPSPDSSAPTSVSMPLAFEPNVGQFPVSTVFQVQALGGTIAFAASGVAFTLPAQVQVLPDPPAAPRPGQIAGRAPFDRRAAAQPVLPDLPPAIVQQQFLGALATPTLTGEDRLPGTVGYLHGDDPTHWYTDIPTYGGIRYASLYPGITLHYSGSNGQIKSMFAIAPGADPARIRWQYTGVTAIAIDAPSGDLVLTIPATGAAGSATTLREAAPSAWQEQVGQRVPVAVQFQVAADNSVGFALGAYDPTQPLIIDPTLSYSLFAAFGTYSSTDAVAVDPDGNVYTVSTLDATLFGDPMPVVTKQSPDGTLLGRQYIPGSRTEYALGIAVDAAGFVTVAGWTTSPDFTHYPDTVPDGDPQLRTPMDDATRDRCVSDYSDDFCPDIFVLRLNPDLALSGPGAYSVTFGGHRSDTAYALAVDAAGNAYVTGMTNSLDFPTVQAFQPACDLTAGYCQDAFVARINAQGTQIDYSSYLGDVGDDSGNGIVVTANGDAYVTGVLNTTGESYNDGDGAFVTKVAPSGALQYRTFLGGVGQDGGTGMTLANPSDPQSPVWVTGWTDANAMVATNAAAGLDSFHGGDVDAFVAQLDPQGTVLATSLLGGTDTDSGADIVVDGSGNLFVAGNTSSGASFPSVDAPTDTAGSGANVFVAMLTANQRSLGLSMQIGGTPGLFDNGSYAAGLAVDDLGHAYIVGQTYSPDYAGGTVNTDTGVLARGFLSKVDGLPRTAPRETISYYVQVNDPEALRRLGCESRQYREQGIVVLAFGRPRNSGTDTNPSYVVGLIETNPPVLVPLSTVEELVLAFAEGYVNWSGCAKGAPVPSPGLPNLALAVGTNNSKSASAQTNPDLNRASGIAWAAMVNRLNDEMEQRGWFPAVRILGGLDAEFGNDRVFGVDPTAWIEGYSQATVFPFVSYNACNGCPQDEPRVTWNEPELEKVYRASIAPALAYPLPQVYFAFQAEQWFNVRRYAFERFGDRKPFAGPMVSCRATNDCNFADRTSWQLAQPGQFLSPPQSWQALYDTLNNATTPDGSNNEVQQIALPFVTDLMRQTAPATVRRTPRS